MPYNSHQRKSTGYRVSAYHVIPGSHDGFHIQVAWEECDDPIWNDFAVLDQDTSKVSDYSRIISHFKPRADGHLITTSRDDLVMILARQENVSRYESEPHTSGRKALRVSVIAYVS